MAETKSAQGNAVPPTKAYKLSAEEYHILDECHHESLVQRSAPLSALLAGVTHYAVKKEYIEKISKVRGIPNVALAAIAGAGVGRYSYRSKCAEKFMALPNSRIGDIYRKGKDGDVAEMKQELKSSGVEETMHRFTKQAGNSYMAGISRMFFLPLFHTECYDEHVDETD